ncbi:MAG: rhodanese [Desulfobulbaceae bacterium]|nr:MAG: rhodanese [Desulfobulbaceae bacterium]
MPAPEPYVYTADDLFDRLTGKADFVLLDVRNEKEFLNFAVEGPSFIPYINIPYYDFIEDIEESIAKIPANEKIRVVCAKEASAKFVSEQLLANGFTDVGYLKEGIVSWGNMLAPRKISGAEAPYELYQIIRPGKASCSYMLIAGSEALVFDPSANIQFYQDFAKERGATISKTFETHRQADYIAGSILLQKEIGAEVMVMAPDFIGADFPFTTLENGQTISLAQGPDIKVIHTPGHTLGSASYFIDGKYLLTGDTIFIQSAGRPDLGGKSEEWSRILYLTLMVTLRDIDDEVLILPGHFTSWQEASDDLLFAAPLGELKKSNVAFHFVHEGRFAQFIRENLRPQPEVYKEIRRINAGWLSVDSEQRNIMDLGKNECGASHYGAVGVSAEAERQKG